MPSSFDMSSDLEQALEDLAEAGADRVLTSGGRKSAVDAMPTLKHLVQQSRGRISVMVCGELSIANVKAVICVFQLPPKSTPAWERL